MAGWPTIDEAGDQRLAQALRAGHPTALAEVYDAYAPRLYDYCHLLLRDRDLAAQSLHDALIIAQERISLLPDLGLFRGWLYAITRAECLRRRAETGLPEIPPEEAEAVSLVDADEPTLRLVRTALTVLSGAQRELLDLALRHELDRRQLAEVLNTSPQDVSLLIGQARHDLDDAFAAVVVAATGRDDCPSVPALAGPADRPMDAEACGRLARHIGGCPICGLRANRKVATARLLHAMPVADLPAGLRDHVLTAATAPENAGARATIAMRSDRPADQSEPDDRQGRPGMWIAFGVAACGILAITGLFLVLPGSGAKGHSTDQAAAPAGASPSADPSEPSAESPSDRPSPTRTTESPTPSPTPTHESKPRKTKASKPAGRTGTPRTTSSGPSTPDTGPSATSGTLTVAGCDMRYSGHCSVKVTAQGGPVHWAVTGVSGAINASGSGELDAGESAYVPVSRTYKDLCFPDDNGSVSFTPGSSASVHWNC